MHIMYMFFLCVGQTLLRTSFSNLEQLARRVLSKLAQDWTTTFVIVPCWQIPQFKRLMKPETAPVLIPVHQNLQLPEQTCNIQFGFGLFWQQQFFIFLIISTVCTYVLTLTYAKAEILLFTKKELLKVKLYILQNSIFSCFHFILGIETSHINKFEINLWHASTS